MSKFDLKKGEYLFCDPCYISTGEQDLEKLKSFDVDDGDHLAMVDGKPVGASVGVDSGEIAIYRATADVVVELDNGLSGVFTGTATTPWEKITFENEM